MKYRSLGKANFDAIVTGELTHYATWLEGELDEIIMGYFVNPGRTTEFQTLFLHREGLTFQHKIDIVRAMIPLFGKEAEVVRLKSLLDQVQDFKSWRNAMAHGKDASDRRWSKRIKISTVSRSGKERIIEITPASHAKTLSEAEKLLISLQDAKKHLLESLRP